jgi:hypothetical protein
MEQRDIFDKIAKTFAKGLINEENFITEIKKAKISKEDLTLALQDIRTIPNEYVWQGAIVALKDEGGKDVTEALLKCVLEHNAVPDKLVKIVTGRKDFHDVLNSYYAT